MSTVTDSEELTICDSGVHIHMFWNKSYFLNMKSTSKSAINLKNEDLNIQGISTAHLEFNVNDVINILILKNALYTSSIMYNKWLSNLWELRISQLLFKRMIQFCMSLMKQSLQYLMLNTNLWCFEKWIKNSTHKQHLLTLSLKPS